MHLIENAIPKIGKILDNLSNQNMPAHEILGLNNLDNMPQDPYMLQALKEISGKEGYREQYIKEQLLLIKR